MKEKAESFLYLFTKILLGVVGIVSVSIQTQYLLPSALGDYSLISGFISVMTSVFASWIGSAGLRYYHAAQKNGTEKQFFTTISADWAVMFAVMLAITTGTAWITTSIPIRPYLLFVVITLFWSSLWEIYEKLMRASSRSVAYCALLIMQSVLNLLVIILYCKLAGGRIEALFLAKILTCALAAVASVCLLRVFRHIRPSSFSRSFNGVVFRYGFPMVGVWSASWLLNYSDRYIINYYYPTSEEVGLYDIAYRFSENSIGIIIAAFNLAFFPAMIRVWNDEGEAATQRMITAIFRYLFLFSVPACTGIFLLSKQIYGPILDPAYSGAAIVMSLASVGFVFMGVNNSLFKIWQLKEKTKMVLYLTVASVVFNITSNIVFIPLFGYVAAAGTTIASYLLVTVIAAFMIRREIRIRIDMRSLALQFLAAAVMGVFLFFARDYVTSLFLLLLCVAAAAAIYFGVLFLLGDLKGDIAELRAFLAKKGGTADSRGK